MESKSKVAYLQCPTGIAGDMCLGALVDAGVPLKYLIEKLHLLGISEEFKLWEEKIHRHGQLATKVHVDLLNSDRHHHDHHHHDHSHVATRHLPDIEKIIKEAGLPSRVERWSLDIFHQLAVAEGAVHGIAPEKVHFHEVGATDAIVDIVGTCLGLDWLGIEEFYCSPLPTGGGTVKAAHGKLTVPVPAVLKLWELRQVPVYSNGIEQELCTPTGVAIACTLCQDFCPPPAMNIQRIGNGAGSINLPIPNILKLWIGENGKTDTTSPSLLETITVLETQIDDLSPQAIGYIFDSLFAAGAVDVFTQSIGMKKSRPGILLTVICHPENVAVCERIVFQETSTLGVRRYTQQRRILEREIQEIEIEYGVARVKVAWRDDDGKKIISNVQPEYEDCAQLARINGIPWREVHQKVLQQWYLLYNQA